MDSDKNSPGRKNPGSAPSNGPGDMEKIIHTLTLRAVATANTGEFKTAFLHMELALWLAQSLEKKCLEAVLLNNLGLVYTLRGAWDRAMLSFDSAMTLAMEHCPDNGRFLATVRNNISCLFDPRIATPGPSPAKDS